MRLLQTLFIFTALSATELAPANGQADDLKTTMLQIDGACVQLTSPTADLTKQCSGKLIKIVFPSDQSIFMVFYGKDAALTFGGPGKSLLSGMTSMTIDSLSVDADRKHPATRFDATGGCSFSNPFSGPVRIECKAETAEGTYTFQFVTNGKQPRVGQK